MDVEKLVSVQYTGGDRSSLRPFHKSTCKTRVFIMILKEPVPFPPLPTTVPLLYDRYDPYFSHLFHFLMY